jgi:N-glycosidase YbiA
MAVIAFTKVALPFGWLGNMAPFVIRWDDKLWRTSEALFQARRLAPGDPGREEIRAEKSPMGAKMASKLSASRRIITPLSEPDVELMEDILRLKLAQHPQLRVDLLATGDAEIVEDCTSRQRGTGLFWGAALQPDGTWKGDNVLGKLWMKLRAEG